MKVSITSIIKTIPISIGLLILPSIVNAQAREQHRSSNHSTQRSESRKPVGNRDANRSQQQRSTNRSTVNNRTNNNDRRSTTRGNNINNSRRTNVNINVDNSKNIRVNNSHNTVVRRNNNIHYGSPHRYGGHAYYCSRPYYYHPYRPYYWGPVWHPWGFFAATLATTAILLSIENQPQPYYYDKGVYYMPGSGGYTVVQAPVGATITVLPQGYQSVQVSPTINNYYYGGTFYEKTSQGYTVVPPTAGTIVANLPQGGTEVTMGNVKYVKYGETYYQPVQVNGNSMYEVVLMQ